MLDKISVHSLHDHYPYGLLSSSAHRIVVSGLGWAGRESVLVTGGLQVLLSGLSRLLYAII
jgi:hypothetical protein